MIYALVQATTILRTADLTEPPTLPASKGLAWLELIDTPRPAYNPLTHGLRTAPPLVTASQYTKQWEVFPLPAEEVAENLAAAKQAQLAAFVRALEAHYDARAQDRRYDNRLTCALRAGYAGPFQAEGTAFAVWMDTCNAYAYAAMAAVEAGQRAAPETPAALVGELPVLAWPA